MPEIFCCSEADNCTILYGQQHSRMTGKSRYDVTLARLLLPRGRILFSSFSPLDEHSSFMRAAIEGAPLAFVQCQESIHTTQTA